MKRKIDRAGLREQETLTSGPVASRATRRAYGSLPLDRQWQLVQELVETRAAELCRAYRDVIEVGFGLARRGDSRRLSRHPHVIFVVRRKRKRIKSGKELPGYLFAYCTVDRRRQLVAIPTDIECHSEYGAIDAHSKRTAGIAVRGQSKAELGAVAVALSRSRNGTRLKDIFLLSCRHVLGTGHLTRLNNTTPARIPVYLKSRNGAVVGKTHGVRGSVKAPPAPTFDAQLAKVTSSANAKAALSRGLGRITRIAKISDLPKLNRLRILTPRGGVAARSRRPYLVSRDIRLKLDGGGAYYIRVEVLECQATGNLKTQGGDSGSPVIAMISGARTFVGMHIAGKPSGLAFFIPAWRLFDPKRYLGPRSGERWRVVNP